MSYPVFQVPAGDVLPVMFSTYAGSTGASVTLTGLAVTDIEIYKDGSVTQRASDAGYTLLDTDGIDFDGITGIHGFSIDTGDNTDAGFYTVGAWFTVVVSAVTVDSQTVNFIACQFRLMAAESIAALPKVDTAGWLGTACATPSVAGVPEVDVTHFNGTAGTFAAGRPEVNSTHFAGTAYATALAAEIDANWDEVLTGAAHNVVNSAGRRIRQMQEAGGYHGYVWIDTIGGTAGTTSFENGTDTEPVSNIANANTLATNLTISQFMVAAGSSITFAATQSTQVFTGENWTLALGGQDISSTHIRGASVSGVCTGTGIPEFHECHIGNVTVPAIHFKDCHIEGTVTLPASTVHFEHCSGNGSTVLEFGAGVAGTTVNMTDFSGEVTVNNLGASGTDVLSIRGHGKIILAASCVGGTVKWDGHFDIVNNGSGITITGDDIYDNTVSIYNRIGAPVGASISADIAGVQSDTNDIQTRLPSALVGGRMDSSVGAVANDTDAVTRLERVLSGNTTGTCDTGCTTTSIATSALSPAASVTDQFKGCILSFDAATTTAALRGQKTDVTASTAGGVLTVTALTTAPASGDTFTLS